MQTRRHPLLSDFALLSYAALLTSAMHLLFANNYGYFLDELYTLACSRHLSLAFVDIPPIAPALLALNTAVFGDSLFAIHLLPALFSGLIVLLTGLMARELGGGRLAMLLSGVAASFVPVWMAVCTLYTYDFLDQFTLVLLFLALIKLLKTENPKWWLAIGAIAGVGLMVKPSQIFFLAALVFGLLLTRHRRMLLAKWPWFGALTAFAIIQPALLWQAANGFPIAEYWLSYSSFKTVRVNPAEFILMQIIGVNPFLLPLWFIGLWYFLFHKAGRRYRLLGVIFLLLFFIFLFTGAKMYMPIPAYAMLLAGGAVVLARFARRGWRRALTAVFLCVIVLTGALQAPNYMPILPVESLITYYDTIGSLFGAKSIKLDNGGAMVLPQYFYDRLEWDTLVRDVADAYNNLPEEQRRETVIVSQNYGYAGAIDQFGRAYGLPNAMCGQLNYFFFSLDPIASPSWLMVGEPMDELQKVFGSVKLLKISYAKYRRPFQWPICLCTDPKFTPDEARAGIKKFE